jgi:dihydrolipoamide dehydrogenase
VPSLPFDGHAIVSSTEALAWDQVPARLVVVGAGAVGLELGSVWSRLGASVTVVEMLPRIAPFADAQMSNVLERALKAQGLAFRLETKVTAARVDGGGVSVTLHGPKGEETLACDQVLVAVGRKPCTTTAGIVEAGVALDERGRVRIDERYLTSVPGVYAIGDLVTGPMLAHKAEEEGVAVAEIVAGRPGHVSYAAIPNVIYTAPELACVGQTEEEVKQSGAPYRVGKSLFRVNGRAKSLAAEEGQVKVIAHGETDRLLGVHIVGARASDMIAEAVMAMEFKASAEDVARTSHAHPTLAEILKEAALAVDKRSING